MPEDAMVNQTATWWAILIDWCAADDLKCFAGMAGEERPSGEGDDKKRYPVGFRFTPTLRELVEFYLLPRLLDQPTVPNNAIIEADAYECDPEMLTIPSAAALKYEPQKYEERGVDDNWFFLSPRSRRYPGGDRPTRRTADNRGRWKPSTGQSKPGKNAAAGHSKGRKGLGKNLSVGAVDFTENTLAYYLGEPKDETKTNTSSTPALDKDVPSSSQSGPAPPESAGEASVTPTSSSKREGKRPALEQPSEHSSAPNKRAGSKQMTMPPGQPVPTQTNGGGMRAPPPVGVVGAAGGHYHGVPGLPSVMQWPPAMYNSMQGPMYMHNRMAPVQGPPVLQLHPPHRAAATASRGPRGSTMVMHPPNQVLAGQPVRSPSFPQPPQEQQLVPIRTPEEKRQQQNTQPAWFDDEGANHPASAATRRRRWRLTSDNAPNTNQQGPKVTGLARDAPPALRWASPSCFRRNVSRREGPGSREGMATQATASRKRQRPHGGGSRARLADADDGAPAAAGRRIARGCLDVPREHLRRPRRGTRKERFGFLSLSRDTGAFFAWPVESPDAMGRNQGTRDENFAVKVQCPTVTSSPRRLYVGPNSFSPKTSSPSLAENGALHKGSPGRLSFVIDDEPAGHRTPGRCAVAAELRAFQEKKTCTRTKMRSQPR
ncbi:hypothetical protein HU200_032801 [Digitaria exilis]|uniref:NAC domain-containing protein n=1 Tax=Digitaria exilis TaxID=1010633 RepID=A0A835BY30_9POAL|nr:hypothetical protein HU200_032801 [Digitaria exilis]